MSSVDAFQPAAAGSVTLAVTAASQFFAVPGNGEVLHLTNMDAANTIFVETDGVTIATVANSFPLRAGQSINLKRLPCPGQPGITAIGSAAGPSSLIVSVGNFGI